MIDIKELRLLAEKATPGPWWIDSHGHTLTSHADGDVKQILRTVDIINPAVRHPETGNLSHWPNDWDASYIATANPMLMIELLDQRDSLVKLLKESKGLFEFMASSSLCPRLELLERIEATLKNMGCDV